MRQKVKFFWLSVIALIVVTIVVGAGQSFFNEKAVSTMTLTQSPTVNSLSKPSPVSQPSSASSSLTPPPDVPAEEWRQMVQAMHQQPDGDQQLVRIGRFLTFQHRVSAWQLSKQHGENASQRQALSQQILDSIPEHLAQKEITQYEAQALSAQVLHDSISDVGQLTQAMARENSLLAASTPTIDPALRQQQDQQLAAYKEQEKNIVAQWQANPSAQNQVQLEAQLDQARQKAFGKNGQ